MVVRAGLSGAEPNERPDTRSGKVKRLRTILSFAIDQKPSEGERFVRIFVDQVRASGGFRIGSSECPGAATVGSLREAFRRAGFELDPEGNVRPTVLENLDGVELTEALLTYVRRAQLGSEDAELVIGTAKNLEEATARHVLKELTGEYATRGRHAHFPVALSDAFLELGFEVSNAKLDRDPYRAFQQALFLLACAVNRLRNDHGDGHGRPELGIATALEGKLSAKSAGLVCEFLLTGLNAGLPPLGQPGPAMKS